MFWLGKYEVNMEEKDLLELCDEKITLTKELQDLLDDETLQKIRRLIQIEKIMQRYICKQENEIEVI